MDITGASGIFANQKFSMANGMVVFGRSRRECDVVFPDNTKGISRRHCRVEKSGNGAMITDLGSSYGTFLNGRKLPPNTPTPLNVGDSFWLGDRANSFTMTGGSQNSTFVASDASSVSRRSGVGKFSRNQIIAALAALVVILAVIFIVINGGNEGIVGTWKVSESPGVRMTFSDSGDMFISVNGEYTLNGELSYTSAGKNMISVKYTGSEIETNYGGSAGVDVLGLLNLGGEIGQTTHSQETTGQIWKYKYNKKDKEMVVYDVNDYKLFSLERAE